MIENLNYTLEDLDNLKEEDLRYVAELCNVNLEKLENELMVYYDQGLNDQDIKEKGFDFDEYSRLKKLEKKAYNCLNKLKKNAKPVGDAVISGVEWARIIEYLNYSQVLLFCH